CTDEPGLDNVLPTPPNRCTEQIQDIITQCGGSLNVQSFDFETCTGTCTPDSCQNEWSALITRCGGFMAVSSWDKTTCSGTCASDPIPQPPGADEDPPGDNEKLPEKIERTDKTNPDGSKEVTNKETYRNDSDGTTHTKETTTYYDPSGNQIGQSTSITHGPGISAPSGDIYKEKYDLSDGLASHVNYQQILDATESFKGTVVYQVPKLITNCLEYVKGNSCEYPPKLTIDFTSTFIHEPVVIDLAPFSKVVAIVKFFFSIICIVGTGKFVMNLFS
ncbi:MAG: hypothetical protein LBD10_00825, partial [Desulfobulbus sp.]|uniref:hypothetical protein n=1 Tax=Desulfobulbus sp. TaxID=895 RepID=UPI002848BA26